MPRVVHYFAAAVSFVCANTADCNGILPSGEGTSITRSHHRYALTGMCSCSADRYAPKCVGDGADPRCNVFYVLWAGLLCTSTLRLFVFVLECVNDWNN